MEETKEKERKREKIERETEKKRKMALGIKTRNKSLKREDKEKTVEKRREVSGLKNVAEILESLGIANKIHSEIRFHSTVNVKKSPFRSFYGCLSLKKPPSLSP